MMPIPIRTPFRRRAAGLFASTLLVCGVATAQAPSPEQTPALSGPRIEVPEVEVDLGQLVRGETAEASFALHNRGGETLRILRAKPG